MSGSTIFNEASPNSKNRDKIRAVICQRQEPEDRDCSNQIGTVGAYVALNSTKDGACNLSQGKLGNWLWTGESSSHFIIIFSADNVCNRLYVIAYSVAEMSGLLCSICRGRGRQS